MAVCYYNQFNVKSMFDHFHSERVAVNESVYEEGSMQLQTMLVLQSEGLCLCVCARTFMCVSDSE